MKNLLTKTLFISLLLSAVIPSGVQAGTALSAVERVGPLEEQIIFVAFMLVMEAVEVRKIKLQVKTVTLGGLLMVAGVVFGAARVAPGLAVVKSVERAAVAAGEMVKAAKIKEAAYNND